MVVGEGKNETGTAYIVYKDKSNQKNLLNFIYSNKRENWLNTLIIDSEESLYYNMLQIDNEIEECIQNNNKIKIMKH